jgi:hypothetical protein
MCISLLNQYACRHADMEFMNRHCHCALIVGPVSEVKKRCPRICGGLQREREVGVEDAVKRGMATTDREEGVRKDGNVVEV